MDQESLEILSDFVIESREEIDALDQTLLGLEKCLVGEHPIDSENIHRIFRTFHSIKGAASFLHLQKIARLTHEAESLLDQIRKDRIRLDLGAMKLFFQAADMLRALIDAAESSHQDEGNEEDVYELVRSFQHFRTVSEQTSASGNDDRQTTLQEIKRLILASTHIIPLVREDGSNRHLLQKLVQDLMWSANRLQSVNMVQQSKAAESLASLAKALQNREKQDRPILTIMERLLDCLANALSNGHDELNSQRSVSITALTEDLIRMESGEESEENAPLFGENLVHLGLITPDQLQLALAEQQRPIGEVLLGLGALFPDQLQIALQVHERKKEGFKQTNDTKTAQSLRVDMNKLDKLGNLVGELVIAENIVTHHESVSGSGFEGFRKSAQILNRISRDIQDLVMSLRMIPIAGTFHKLTRATRDIAESLGKHVRVDVEGEDTEIDKSVVDQLSAPLTHMVRNALDHGMELPEERESLGKPKEGRICFEACQEGGEIVIRLSDDGRGIDADRVLRTARERGLVDESFQGSQSDIFRLIFLPGFSTANEVTELSGRGVGMDVVKQCIDSLQGRIDISSTKGIGTLFTLRIPLTLSIIEGMLVRVGTTVLTIPLLRIRESLLIGNQTVVRTPDGRIQVQVRESLLPLIELGSYFGEDHKEDELKGRLVVLVEEGGGRCGLIVDEILGQRQTVIKRVSNFFDRLRGVSGFSILANGEITMVLDVSSFISNVH